MNSSSVGAEHSAEARSFFILVRSLDTGGAERQIVCLANGLADRGHRVTVCTFYRGGALEGDLDRTRVTLIDLDKRGRWDFGFLKRLRAAIRNAEADVVYGFLNGGNMAGAAVKYLVRPTRLVWSVRVANMDLTQYDWLAPIAYWLECRLSRIADIVIANSQTGARHALLHGFPADRMRVVWNGIDTERFRPDADAREATRQRWGIAPDHILIGMVARLDPMKDHATFLRAAAELAARDPRLRFVSIGGGDGAYSERVAALAEELGLRGRMLWAGREDRVEAAINGLDLCCSSSTSEGFSNAIAEAMACGVPCVVTDVGDSAVIVGDPAKVVPQGDPAALAAALRTAITELGPDASRRARDRIVAEFPIAAMVARTEHACLS